MNLEGLTFDDVLLKPQFGVLDHRADADISVPELSLDIPLIAAPMPSVSSIELINKMIKLGGGAVVNRMERNINQRIADFKSSIDADVAVGLDKDEFDRLYDAGARVFWMDIAHGHSKRGVEFIRYVRMNYPHAYLIAGSVATSEGAFELIQAGANALRVGIGPGSVCTTRQVTGVGVPQLQAIQECSNVGEEYFSVGRVPVIADGGIRSSGDIVKALAAGANAVMIGGLFAQSFEAGSQFHYGNASRRVNGHHAPEGIEIAIADANKERLKDIVKRLCWGIRSTISYLGATNIKELQDNAEWIRLTDAGRRESKLA